ncbi:putative TRAFAC class myosin-kinesin ATPase superfamily [Halocaridina rubra]|uniref:TRAFAC class myosin-kinesin ATPase superfamily n=1 Tax=Halocaridina rubra TaxID=373956 RepID=A0AAN8XIZ1_HALRR
MNTQRAGIKVVVTLADSETRSVNMSRNKHPVQKASSHFSEDHNTQEIKTPRSGTYGAPSNTSTGMGAGGTPKTPLTVPSRLHVTGKDASHLSPKITPKGFRAPKASSASKTPTLPMPRHGPPGVSCPKRLKKTEKTPNGDSAHKVGGGLKRSKSVRDVENKDGGHVKKKSDVGGIQKIFSSSNLNIITPDRVSGGVSSEVKTPLSSRTSLGRLSSSKSSLGTNTPTVTVTRRSSSGLRIRSETENGMAVSLTPDIIRHHDSSTAISPSTDHYARTESTAVSVGVRIRPMNQREADACEAIALEVSGNTVMVVDDTGPPSHSFTYDHSFWSHDEHHPFYASQERVYNAIAKPLLEKAYEGYNTCLFAYGQTGSGKSYTMLGDGSLEEPSSDMISSVGVIPRFCLELFARAAHVHSLNPPDHQTPQSLIEVELSYIEIYNERIYDLLSVGTRTRREALRLREHPQTGPYVEGVSQHLVSSYNDVQTWLDLGNKERSIAATGMNDKSSRSHAVFTIRLTQMSIEDVEGEQLESSKISVINLVDLAGSERVAAAQSQGDRLKEGVCINKSLLTLGKVIMALADSAGRRRVFIPYRESVLTYLLKESLGGNSRTAMIATVSPCKSHIEESLSTLRYALQARKIVNHNYVNEDPTAMIIRSLKEEVERLRKQHLVKDPSLLFESELLEDEFCEKEDKDAADHEKQRALLQEKERAIREKEREKTLAIKEKEAEIALLKEQVRSQQLLNERNRNLEQRLRETELKQQQALENQRLQGIVSKDALGPQLVNLTEDPQLSELLSYKLEEGTITLGHSNSNLVLKGLLAEDVHCSIVNRKGQLTLHPKLDKDTYVNGKLVTFPQELKHDDRLVLAGIYYFRVNNPEARNCIKAKSSNVDFYFSQQELLREQEKRLKKEAETVLAASRAELENEMRLQRDLLMQDLQEASCQLNMKEQYVHELEENQWKLEEEKNLLEEQLFRTREKSHQAPDISLLGPGHPSSNILQEVEAVFNESVMEIQKDTSFYTSPKLGFQIKEANQIAKMLCKPYEFMVQELLSETGCDVIVLLKDHHHQTAAKLTLSMFALKLQMLKDMLQGEENEQEMFDEGIVWERTEDVCCIPGFINKLRGCVNSSINCSFGVRSHSFLSRSFTNRRSSLLFGSEKVNAASNCGLFGKSSGTIFVAAALHDTLTFLPSPNASSEPLQTAVDAIIDLHSCTQNVKNHITEPDSTLSDEEFSKSLILLLCFSQVTMLTLSSLSVVQLETSYSNCLMIQEKLRNSATKIQSCASKIFQGVKNEVDSLVDEESRGLMCILQTLIADIGKLSIIASLPIPTTSTSKVKPGGVLFTNFVEGLRGGLAELLQLSAEAALRGSNILTACKRSGDNRKFIEAYEASMTNIADFLKRYTRITAGLELAEGLSEEEQKHIISEWLRRVESTSYRVIDLSNNIDNTRNHLETSTQLNEEFWRKSLSHIMEGLENLCDTVQSCYDNDDSSLHSKFDGETSGVVLEEFTTAAKKTHKSVVALVGLLHTTSFSLPKEVVHHHSSKLWLGQWPKNCDEYFDYLKKGKMDLGKSPMKSSLRSTSSFPLEEKRVRFNIRSNSPSSGY